MKQRLVSLAIAGVMLLSVGGAVSAAPTDENAVAKSCHGQTVANLTSNGTPPGHATDDVAQWHKDIKAKCANFGG